MFIKITKTGKYEYVQLVRTYRQDGKVKQEVVLNLGRMEEVINNPSLARIGQRLIELSTGKKPKHSLPDVVSEAYVVNWGYLVYRSIWEQFGLDKLLISVKENRKIKFDLEKACFLMAVQHLLDPKSKLGTYLNQSRYFGLKDVSLNHLYRSLDVLCDNKEKLETYIFQKNLNLFNMQVDVVFYDVTTFSFESVKKDSLRDFGFSKEGKFNEVQVVMGLIVDIEGRPIGYELFAGNTFEGKTLEAALDKLSARFGIRKVIVVADRGINSRMNLKAIADKGYEYIVAFRIKTATKSIQEEILNPEGYVELPSSSEEELRYKVIKRTNRFKEKGEVFSLEENLIVTYSSKRAKKDQKDRERLIEKALFLASSQSRVRASNKRGGKKYIKEADDARAQWVIDHEAIERDALFDGYYAIQTNNQSLSVEEVLEAYHSLWKIEESFRIMKTTLEVQPVFHWTERRIKGHFVMCFLAFLMERTLELTMKQSNYPLSPNDIRQALNSLNFSLVSMDGQEYLINHRCCEAAKKILRVFRIKSQPNIQLACDFSI